MKTKLSTNNLISTESIIHCDLDSFFASVEQALRPELHGKPVAVSAARGQGVITAATYEAKRAGVRVGMPYFKAKKLLPSLIFVEARMEAYHRAGDFVKEIITSTGAQIESLGLDECFINLNTICPDKINFYGGDSYQFATSFACYIKDKVTSLSGLSISIGVGSNKIIAKLASDASKPDGLLIVPIADELDFIRNQPLSEITGIGHKTQQKLYSIGLTKVSDVSPYSQLSLRAMLGKRQGDFIYLVANNLIHNPVKPNPAAKSTSVMRSFPDPGVLAHPMLLELHSELLDRLISSGRSVRFLSVFATNGFTTIADRIDLKAPNADPRILSISLRKMISKIPENFISNFLGISFEGLSDIEQLRLDLPLGDYIEADYYEPPEFITLTPSEYLKRSIFKGMSINHPNFGVGRILSLQDTGFLAAFSDKERLLDFQSPISIIENKFL